MKKSKHITSIVIIFILLLSSIGMYKAYSYVELNSKEIAYGNYMCSHIQEYNIVLNKRLNTSIKEYDYYFNIQGKQTSEINDTITDYISFLNSEADRLDDEKNLIYYAIDTNTNKVITNTDDAIQQINTNKELQDKYHWYLQLSFDENGDYQIKYISDQSDTLQYDFEDRLMSNVIFTDYEADSSLSLNNPKNMIITYAIPNKIATQTNLSHYTDYIYEDDIIRIILPYIIIGILLVSIVIFIIPWKYLKDHPLFKVFAKIKFEFLATGWISLITLLSFLLLYLCYITLNNNINSVYEFFAIQYTSAYLTPFINVFIWFLFFTMFSILAYMIKYFIHKGVKKYFIENTFISWCFIKIKDLIYHIMSFDFEDDINQAVLKIVAFNFIAISIMSLFFVAGPLIALIYSMIIFFILKKKFTEIKNDYHSLLTITKQLSSGHFDFEINEDIGMFNPLKNEFSHIKTGFEKAVKEEIKSEKTKAELITNVSHDLKTPLTSIITYIDLLKNEYNEDYIQILEKNSLRLKNLIDDLFEVSKATTGDVKLDLVDVDIISLIKQAEFECLDQLNKQHLDIRYSYSTEKIICRLDSSKTYRIFENLFMNISKYALENTRVYIHIIEDEQNIMITFKNISKDEMKFNESDIVERFVQGDESRNTSGSGLGLAIVKSFTELQGGKFFVKLDGDLFKAIIQFKK